jgi:hypothetical protein
MLTIQEVAEASGLPLSQLRQWTKDGVFPPHLYVHEQGNRFDYAPVVLAFCEAVVYFRLHFGINSRLPVQLAKAAMPNVERLWQEGVPEGTKLRIYVPGIQVIADAAFITATKEKWSTTAV